MLRKVLLILMASGVSCVLSALAGYILYSISEGRSEATLSLVVLFTASPLIFVMIGGLVGFLSKDRPVPTSIIGLAPMTILLLSNPTKPASIPGWLTWLAPILVYMPLGAIAAAWAWQYRNKSATHSG